LRLILKHYCLEMIHSKCIISKQILTRKSTCRTPFLVVCKHYRKLKEPPCAYSPNNHRWLALSFREQLTRFYHKESSSPRPAIVPIEGAVLFELVKGSLFCLFLKLVQINFIFTDNVRILYIYARRNQSEYGITQIFLVDLNAVDQKYIYANDNGVWNTACATRLTF
jgi:hypothetical protein